MGFDAKPRLSEPPRGFSKTVKVILRKLSPYTAWGIFGPRGIEFSPVKEATRIQPAMLSLQLK